MLLAAVVLVAREPLPRIPRIYVHLAVMAAINIVIPFTLITWAEQSVDSAIAAILNGAVPLIVIVLAALTFHDEPITLNRLVGVVVGYVGVIVLVAPGPRRRARAAASSPARSRCSARRSPTPSARSTRGATSGACDR